MFPTHANEKVSAMLNHVRTRSDLPPLGISPQAKGFTLTELAVVLVIVSLLIGGMLIPLSSQTEMRSVNETQKTLSDIREALLGFAMSHQATDGKPYLPCPASTDTGLEDSRVANACPNPEGRIPWATLGLGQTDAWNNRIRYRVDPAFSNNAVGFTLASTGNLRVCSDMSCAAGTIVASGLPVVLVSHGPNGAGANNNTGGVNPPPTAGTNEAQNTDTGSNDFVSKTPDPNFDDIVIWLSPNILFNRMITAGKLP